MTGRFLQVHDSNKRKLQARSKTSAIQEFQLKLIAHDCGAYAVGCLPVQLSFLVGQKTFTQLRDIGWLVGWPLALPTLVQRRLKLSLLARLKSRSQA